MGDLQDVDCAIKVLVVGNGGVGKSSLIKRFCKGQYTDDYKKTIGVDFMEKQLSDADTGETVTLMLWDTAGQEEFGAMTRSYYRGTGAAVLCFSITDRASFDAVPTWRQKIVDECGDVPMAIMQNKTDVVDGVVVTKEEGEALAEQLKLPLFRASVKNNHNVLEVFEFLVAQRNLAPAAKEKEVTTVSYVQKNESETRNQTVSITKPSKVRTGGKKKMCIIL